MGSDRSDPLLAACRIVVESIRAPLAIASRSSHSQEDFNDVVEIARAARLRVRRTMLRGEWWKLDVGPLVAWYGDERQPVALIRGAGNRYTMIETKTGSRRTVDGRLAADLAPEAAVFYPALPSRALGYRDLLGFSIRHSRGNFGSVMVAIAAIGALSLIPP